MRFRLIPREERFYDDFEALAAETCKGARMLEAMLAPDRPIWDKAEEIKEIEHKCDFLTHEIYHRLNRTFVTPMDREDIYALARSLDDVMDAIDASAMVINLYQIDRVKSSARDLARIISESTDQVLHALRALEKRDGVLACSIEINRLENEADRMYQGALRALFEEEKDPITIMKWKEIFDYLEAATDRCEDAANVLEGVVVKHA